MSRIMSSEELTNERIYKFPTSQVLFNGKKTSYSEVIDSLQFQECNDAVIRVCNKYSQIDVENLIDSTPFLSDVHKEFYKYIMKKDMKRYYFMHIKR